MRLDSVLVWIAIIHVVLAIACSIGLLFDADPIVGVHPMLKPLKFAISIAIFLATMSVIVPMLSVSPQTRRAIEWVLAIAMAIEMVAIMMQALRGTTSHYNETAVFDRAVWRTMLGAIIAITITMVMVAFIATTRTLRDADGRAIPALSALAWRAGLWLFQLATISGFAMGGRRQHTVGGDDGGPGLPGVNWSVMHGDLRISHFLAMHAIQILPLIAIGARVSSLPERGRWMALLTAIAVQSFAIVWTLSRAFIGRTPW